MYLGNNFTEEDFYSMIFAAIKEREQTYLKTKKTKWKLLEIPKFQQLEWIPNLYLVNIFKLLKFIVAKGRSHLLLRCKPTKELTSESNEEEKESRKILNKSERKLQILKREIEKLRDVISQNEKDSQEIQKYAEFLSELYDRGVIEADRKICVTEIKNLFDWFNYHLNEIFLNLV